MDRLKAAVEAATQPSMPLLGATVIAVMAFYPIVASKEGAGEYCRTLFIVVGLSLMISWVLAITLTPVLCLAWIRSPKAGDEVKEGEHGRFFSLYRSILQRAMNHRYAVLLLMTVLLVASLAGFTQVKQMFFPESARPQLMIDFWMPQGTSIEEVSEQVKRVEDKLNGNEDVRSVMTFVGQGPPRFYLPVEPEMFNSSYAQVLVNVKDSEGVNRLIRELQPWFNANFSDSVPLLRRYALGPGETWKVEARFISSGDGDPEILRAIGNEAMKRVADNPLMRYARLDWRQQSKVVKAQYNQNRARWAGVSRGDVADAMHHAYDGIRIGTYREGDESLPIVVRQQYEDRSQASGQLEAVQVRAQYSTQPIPLQQVVDGVSLGWEDGIITRFNRRRMIALQAVPKDGILAEQLRQSIKQQIESIQMPPGYTLMWDGEHRSSSEAQASLIPGMVPAAVVMSLIIVGLFNAYRPPLIIMLTIPLALIGVSSGLLITGQPFGFMALLGLMSLSGMMIKNAIVLLDELNIQLASGHTHHQAIMTAATSRLRPVLLAAGTTVLGVIPLLQDVFWVSMSVTIMFGLAFGTILTMVVIPVLYAVFYRLPVVPVGSDESEPAQGAG
jgi:multidrug efflux pump subunit AcrB